MEDKSKDKIAIALKYEKEKDLAPRVTAKGKGPIAEKILQLARENNIEIQKDKPLADILALIDINSPIPAQAYIAVAEILSYIYKANASLEGKNGAKR
jgi:flagellar biosynthesis protein